MRLHARDEGRGPPLLLVHSLGTDGRLWEDVARSLPGRRVIRPDLRGAGLSEAPPGEWSYADLAADLAELLDGLDAGPAAVAGVSIGGPVAVALTHARPDLVSGLVLIATAARLGDPAIWSSCMETLRADGPAAVNRPLEAARLGPGVAPGRALALRHMIERQPVDGTLGLMSALRDGDVSGPAAGLALPTVCVACAEDDLVPPEAVRGLAERIPGARLETLSGLGHLPMWEDPAQVARLLA